VQGGGNGNGKTRNDSQEWEWALRGGDNEKDSAERGIGMAKHGMTARNGNGLCGEGRMRKTVRGGGNGNGKTRNGSLPLTTLISSRDIRICTIECKENREKLKRRP
jgi:hypothetical protein